MLLCDRHSADDAGLTLQVELSARSSHNDRQVACLRRRGLQVQAAVTAGSCYVGSVGYDIVVARCKFVIHRNSQAYASLVIVGCQHLCLQRQLPTAMAADALQERF